MDKQTAKKLSLQAIDDYNKTAPLWSTKRWKLPTDIVDLKKYLKAGEKVLDLGCGSGYFCELCENVDYAGADVSVGQINICKEKYPKNKFVVVEPFKLPFKDEEFDNIFCLSTIHHIASTELQKEFLTEARRVLKNGGVIFVSAWNFSDSDIPKNAEKINNENDILVPFKDSEGNTLAKRYIHCFTQKELEDITKEAGFKVLESRIVSRGTGKFSNVLVIAKKI
jgi:ubiquinone/menaquinone biosynthesis C-methylase UbiE